jgi:hypothetical protein
MPRPYARGAVRSAVGALAGSPGLRLAQVRDACPVRRALRYSLCVVGCEA